MAGVLFCKSASFSKWHQRAQEHMCLLDHMQDMMEACRTSGKFPGQVEFTGEETSKKGKMMSNCQTREALNWQPKYSSFEDFMAGGANDFYNTSALYAAKPPAS